MAAIIETKNPLYEYWENLQVVKEVEMDKFESILDQEIRRAIVDRLAVGIIDEEMQTDKRRHAMSATEIRKELNKKRQKDDKINSPNLYFHLQKLEDADLVKVVGQIPTGKRLTTYYGRTAKTFIPKQGMEDKSHICKELENKDLNKLAKDMNPKNTEVDEIIRVANNIGKSNIHGYKDWIRENEQYFKEVDLDFRKMLDLYSLLKNLDGETFEALTKLAHLLKIK